MDSGQIAILTSIIAAAALIISRVIEHIDKFAPTKPSYDKDAQVDAMVLLIREKYKCSRVSILGYHNGGHWIDGNSQSKFTLRHESCDSNTISLMASLSGVATSMLKEQPFILDTKYILFEPDINTIRNIVTPSYYESMERFNVVTSLGVAIQKRMFNWKKFKFEVYLIGSLHMDWQTSTWGHIILDNHDLQIELIKTIDAMTYCYCNKEYKNVNRLTLFMDICENIKSKQN